MRKARAARLAVAFLGLAGLLHFATPGNAGGSQITSVSPPTAKVGDVLRATGGGLSPGVVDELYLTNPSQDVKIQIIEQTETLITFRVPAGVKPGRWALMIHLKAGAGTGLFEQPIKVTVE